jgi:putative tricarboxylic transport membrane protein
MAKRDVAVASLALAFGAAAAFESARLPFGTIHNPGEGFFPWWASVTVVLLATILLIQGLNSRSTSARDESRRLAKVIVLLVILAAYTFLLDPLGYPICTFLLVLFMLRVLDPQRWRVALSIAVLAAAGSYVVFAVWLSVPLPRGPL